jgi:hypothetical protein
MDELSEVELEVTVLAAATLLAMRGLKEALVC